MMEGFEKRKKRAKWWHTKMMKEFSPVLFTLKWWHTKMMEGFQTFCSHQNDGGSETSLKKLASPSSVPLAPAPPLHRRFGPVPYFHHGLRETYWGPAGGYGVTKDSQLVCKTLWLQLFLRNLRAQAAPQKRFPPTGPWVCNPFAAPLPPWAPRDILSNSTHDHGRRGSKS